MQKSINLKIIYGFIYGVLSLVVGGLFLFYFFAQKLGQFWLSILFVNGNGGVFSGKWLIICLCCFVAFIAFSCWLGVKRGMAVFEKEEKAKEKRFTMLLFYGSVVLLIVCVFLFINVIVSQKKAYDQLSGSIARIDKVRLQKKDNKLMTSVKFIGQSDELYELQISYRANSFVVKELDSVRRRMTLKDNMQIVDFELPFTRLSKLYRAVLKDYVPSFKREIDFEEFIDVVVTFRLVKHRTIPLLTFIRLRLGWSQVAVSARLRFRCKEESCEVVLDPLENKEELLQKQ